MDPSIDRNQGRVHVAVNIVDDDSPDYSWLGEFVERPTSDTCYSVVADAVRLAGSELWRDRKGRIVAEPEDTRNWRYQYIVTPRWDGTLASAFADADRMVGLSRGDWWFVGIVARVSIDHTGYMPREIGYASCFGFESDAGDDYLRAEARNLAHEAIQDARTFVRSLAS